MTALAAPDRSLSQRLEALERANDVRSKRARLKRDLKAGRVCVVDVLADPPAFVATMKILDLLLAMPRVGAVKANRLLFRCRISPSKTISGASERQRGELVALLRGRA